MTDALRKLSPIGRDALGLLAGAAILGGACWMVRPGPDLGPGNEAPDVRLPVVANGSGSVQLGARPGHVTVVEFFASWCGVCERSLPQVDRAAARSHARFIAVSVDDKAQKARAAASSWHLSGEVAWDDNRRAVSAYGVRSLPTLFVIDRNGKLAATHIGRVDTVELHAEIVRAGGN